jgi:hypothetical protein
LKAIHGQPALLALLALSEAKVSLSNIFKYKHKHPISAQKLGVLP